MISSKEECERRVAKYKDDELCIQALEHYQGWLDYHNGIAPAPTMIPASSLEDEDETKKVDMKAVQRAMNRQKGIAIPKISSKLEED